MKAQAISSPVGAGRRSVLSVVWFRNDLRLSDHAPLLKACDAKPAYLLPIYCLDKRRFKARQFPANGTPSAPLLDVPRTGPWRCRFLLQALHKLQQQLRRCSSDLFILQGHPEVEIPDFIARLMAELQGNKVSHSPLPWHVTVHYHQEALPEPADIEECFALGMQAVMPGSVTWDMNGHWSHSLYHPDDLPYASMAADVDQSGLGQPPDAPNTELQNSSSSSSSSTEKADLRPQRFASIPGTMTRFRKALHGAQSTPVRLPLQPPAALPPLPATILTTTNNNNTNATSTGNSSNSSSLLSVVGAFDAAGCGELLDSLGRMVGRDYQQMEAFNCEPGSKGTDWNDPRSSVQHVAGEEAAHERLHSYVWGSEHSGSQGREPALNSYAATRAQASGVDASTHMSPYLSLGCISPRVVWYEASKAREHALQSDSSQGVAEGAECLQMHLEVRDFYIFTALKGAGSGLFSAGGMCGSSQATHWSSDPDVFKRWAAGRTGLPFVDACMRELAGSGYMSNRGRQNVASFLTKELGIDWRMGAALFESLLLDHDTAVNTANWNYFTGMGSDPRDRRFKTISQGITYDPEARFITSWVPELAHLPLPLVHAPSLALAVSVEEQLAAVCGEASAPKESLEQPQVTAEYLGLLLSQAYTMPMVDLSSQLGTGKANNRARSGKK